MTAEQIRQTIYDAFYRVIEIGNKPALAQFLQKTLKETWPKGFPIPRDWPDFWWQAVVLEIQKGFMKTNEFWDELDVNYLKTMHDDDKTWENVCADADVQADSLIKL